MYKKDVEKDLLYIVNQASSNACDRSMLNALRNRYVLQLTVDTVQ